MTRFLFVYGTLIPTFEHPMGARLAREARTLGPATVAGRLHDLGPYPALVLSPEGAGPVHGILLDLEDSVRSLRWLDRYEGAEYERVEVEARLATGERRTAWAYVYRRDVARAPVLGDGRWRPHAARR
jgi:gamma-glutamylcyclotransferase (GGCT)/AIG2-like uncharacterized protein YtfP